MWIPLFVFISNRFYRTQNNFGPLNCHITTELSWVVTKTPAVPSADILRWLQRHRDHRQSDCNGDIFATFDDTKVILGLCNVNEWWKWHRSHILASFWCNVVCDVTYLPISPQGRSRFELYYRGYFQQPVEFKTVRTEKQWRTKPPVEISQCEGKQKIDILSWFVAHIPESIEGDTNPYKGTYNLSCACVLYTQSVIVVTVHYDE